MLLRNKNKYIKSNIDEKVKIVLFEFKLDLKILNSNF